MDGATARAVVVPFEASRDIAGYAGVVARRVSIAPDYVHEALFIGGHGAGRCMAYATTLPAVFG